LGGLGEVIEIEKKNNFRRGDENKEKRLKRKREKKFQFFALLRVEIEKRGAGIELNRIKRTFSSSLCLLLRT
jgi:hypothetical protein